MDLLDCFTHTHTSQLSKKFLMENMEWLYIYWGFTGNVREAQCAS